MSMKKIKIKIKAFTNKILDFYFNDEDYIKLFWFNGTKNFGDLLNPVLLKELTGKKIKFIKPKYYHHTNFLAVGSILDVASKDSIVWGSGFINDEKKCYQTPKKICAVRGPKTREVLLSQGIDCPEVYGDPGLLLPMIYNPKKEKKYKLGIIPHYVDKNNLWLSQFESDENIKIIDIQNENVFAFIDEVLSCEKIASSSLHGIITADAYSIPSIWLEFSDRVVGNGFKFLDYFLSVNRIDSKPLIIKDDTDISKLYSSFYDYKIDIDLNKLLKAAPFTIKNTFIL